MMIIIAQFINQFPSGLNQSKQYCKVAKYSFDG